MNQQKLKPQQTKERKMKEKGTDLDPSSRLQRHTWSLIIAWTMIVVASFLWDINRIEQEILDTAHIQAQGVYEKDLLFLKNPAFMTRQIHELAAKEGGIRARITSLKPMRPENAPDPWEKEALQAFERGETEVSAVGELEGEEYLRLMRPMQTGKECLSCHAEQGHRVGDIQGGISVSIPIAPLQGITRRHLLSLAAHVFLWMLGLVGIVWEGTRLRHSDRKHRQMEQKLVYTQRLRALRELSAEFSHNFDDILVHIQSPAQLLLRATDDPDVLREARKIVAGANRARELVQRLNQAVRGELEGTEYAVSIDEEIHRAIREARPRWKEESEARGITIEIITELGEVPSIRGNRSELSDILLNLLYHAVDAMPAGGAITFQTKTIADRVQLTVTDTGIGMDEEARTKVFEPLFTANMNIGTELDLATVYDTMTRWGGDIQVESHPGEGTTFILRFPVWAEPELQQE